jgi:tetratricopeptide (TPR) repeat protein
VTAQLTDTRSGETLWTTRFDPDDADIFTIQDRIALAVAQAVDVFVKPEGQEHILRSVSGDETAYEFYLRGRASAQATEIRGDYSEAIAYYERALEIDPDLALAWAGLANIIFWQGRNGHLNIEIALERSWEASNRALEIDPKLGEAYSHRIFLHIMNGDKEKSREAYERAIEYNPSWPYSYLAFGMLLNSQYHYDEAIEVFRRGLELQPFRPDPLLRQNLANAYVGSGDYERGMQMQAANYLEHMGTNKEAQFLHWLAAQANADYRFDEAAAFLAIGRRDGLVNVSAQRIAATASLGMGRIEEAARFIERADAMRFKDSAGMLGRHPETPLLEAIQARIALVSGDESAVLELLRRATQFVASNPEGQIERWQLYDICYWYLALRRYEEAARWTAKLVVDQDDIENLTMAAFAHEKNGKTDLAETYRQQAAKELESALVMAPDSRLVLVMGSSLHAVSGNTSEALDLLERAYDAHYRDIVYLTQMPLFDSIRGEPQFRSLLRRIREELAEMSRRYDQVAAAEDFEILVERHLNTQVTANVYY